MTAAFAEDLEDQIRGPVEDFRLLIEARRRAYESTQLNELLNLVERPGVLPDQRHDVEGADLGRPGGVLDADASPDDALELELAVPVRDHARGVQKLAHLLDRHVGGQRLGRFGKLDAEGSQGGFSGIHVQDSPRTGGEQLRSTSWARLRWAAIQRVAVPAAGRQPEPVKGWLTGRPTSSHPVTGRRWD